MSKAWNVVAVLVCLAGLATPADAGSSKPWATDELVKSGDTDVYQRTYFADEPALVAVSVDGDTDLDVLVYDAAGRLVASDLGVGDDCLVRWVPTRTQVYTIKVVNRGDVYNRYRIRGN